jgi:2-aminoadipate transaminase
MTPPKISFSLEGESVRPSPIRLLAPLINDPTYISFAGGVPSPETFPVTEIAEIAARLLREKPHVVLQYSPTWGPTILREFLVERMKGFGFPVEIDQILCTSGSQQALDLVARVLVDPGDVFLVELPSYVGALGVFRARSARLVGIPARGDGGWDLPALEARVRSLREEGGRIKGVYAIPNFQNPAGTSIPVEQRPEIARFLSEQDLLLLEDDPYGELNYVGAATPPIASFDREGRVVYLGTFSKVLCPALRTAWIAGPKELVAKCELVKQAADLCSSALDQTIVGELCRSGRLGGQIERLRAIYRGKRKILLDGLESCLPTGCRFTRAEGGLFTWITIPSEPAGVDSDELLRRSLEEEKIAFLPGSGFFVEGNEGKRCMRLTFAKETDDRMKDGTVRLGALLGRVLAELESGRGGSRS